MPRKWVELEEAYTWSPCSDDSHTKAMNKIIRRHYPDNYAYVPEALWDRLTAAWAEIDAVVKQIEPFVREKK